MPDHKNFPNPDEMSIDALLDETKMQIEAEPGEAGTMQEHALQDEPEAPSNDAEPFVLPQQELAQAEDFTPDFGSAFSDYGTYEEPQEPFPTEEQATEPDEFYDEEPYEEIDSLRRPKRPKRKTGKRFIPLFVKVLLYFVLVGVISVGIGYGAWDCVKDVLGFGRSDETVKFIVYEGDTIDDIAERLKEQGIIKYPWLFKFYCSFTDSGDNIMPNTIDPNYPNAQPGYELHYNYDYHALIEAMQPAVEARKTVFITIPEGYSAAQIFALMEEKNVCTVAALEECSATVEFDYWFLEGIPYGANNRLEGFLFPDTYEFYEEDDPERVLDKLLSNFNKKFGEGAISRLDALNDLLAERWRNAGYGDQYIAEHAFTVYELITVASMIEKETAAFDESGDISSVIYNRLCNPAEYPYLNIDATVVYALGGKIEYPLTNADLQVDSVYNTYKVIGLPAGPIANPGLSSISAALYPTDTDYYYYALDTETGYHHFSKTKAEHDAFVEGQNYGN